MLGTAKDDPLTRAEEGELVRHFVNDWHWGGAVLQPFDLPSDRLHLLEVDLKSLGVEGDIDLLAVSPNNPSRAIAVQFKLVKVRAKAFESQEPNKLQEIEKLVLQTNRVARLGFWRSYACVLVLVDSYPGDVENLYGGLTSELNSVLESALRIRYLHKAAGFVQVNIVQGFDQPPLTTGEIFSHVRKISTAQQQRPDITAWVADCVRQRGEDQRARFGSGLASFLG